MRTSRARQQAVVVTNANEPDIAKKIQVALADRAEVAAANDFELSEGARNHLIKLLDHRISGRTWLVVVFYIQNCMLAIVVLMLVSLFVYTGWTGATRVANHDKNAASYSNLLAATGSGAVQATILALGGTVCFRLLRVSVAAGNYWTREKKKLNCIRTRIEIFRWSKQPLRFSVLDSLMAEYDAMDPNIEVTETNFADPKSRAMR